MDKVEFFDEESKEYIDVYKRQVRTWEQQVLIWAVQMQEAMQMMM